jgi:hypothetical protein
VEVAVGVVVCGAEGIDLHRIRLRGWRTPTLWLAAVLTVLGLGVFPYKALTLGFPVLPGEKSDLWDVGAPVKLSGAAGRSKVSLFMPRSTGRLAVVDESSSRAASGRPQRSSTPIARVWAVRRASEQASLPFRGRDARAWRPAGRVPRSRAPDRFKARTWPRLSRCRARCGAVGRSRYSGRPARQAPRRSQARPVT